MKTNDTTVASPRGESRIQTYRISDKKHGYYKDINTIKDYGDVIVVTGEYDHKINLKNGNKHLPKDFFVDFGDKKNGKIINQFGGEYVLFTSNNKRKIGRIRCTCYYLK